MAGWRRAAALSAFVLALIPWVGVADGRADDEECLACHAVGAGMVELDERIQVRPEVWVTSVHAEMGFGCTDCHVDVEDFPHGDEVEPATCATCHEAAQEAFDRSVHAAAHGDGEEFSQRAPCGSCHGVHNIRPVSDSDSPVFFRNIPQTCGKCHGDLGIVQSHDLDRTLVSRYEQSVHGHALEDPDARPAVCTDCHGSHQIVLGNDPTSKTDPFHIAETCGQCHEQQEIEYVDSVHGVAFKRGRTAAPTCIDCHGIHAIKMVPHGKASPREAHLVRTTCPACHSSEALMSEFGVTPARVSSYKASYHGLANTRGNTAVADCASCHGIHAIYPSTDARSTVAPKNLQKTCGGCHPRAGVEFAKSPVHYAAGASSAGSLEVKITEWVKRIYWVLLIGVLGGMVLHNIIIMSWYVRRNWRRDKQARMLRRFDRAEVMQHGLLVISFFVLVFTGFMLAYPDTWWSHMLVDLGVTESIRRWTHRVAGVVMILASIAHMVWILGTPYGRAELRRIAPGMRDVREVLQNMRFHLGRSKHPAAFAKFDYPAKAEYWALVWGTIVMVITGLILWFPVLATSIMPGWSVKVAEVIHLFEAWLATLAIVIFHFFYVMGHPEVYPISFAMIHGGMKEEQAKHHHPAWVDEGTAVEVADLVREKVDV